MEKMKDVKLGKEKVGDYWSPSAKENSAVDALAASSVRSNLGRILPMLGAESRLSNTSESAAHWFMSSGLIYCCSASGTEQLPSSFRTTWPR